MMGRLALAFNKLEVAEEYFRKSLEVLPDVRQRRFIYSKVLRMLNRNEEALVEIDRCLEATPEDHVILKGRAVVLSLLGRRSEATTLYLKLLIEAPDRDKPYYNLALQHKFIRGDEFSEVFDDLSKSVTELEPEGARKSAHFALGKYFDDLKDYSIAFHHYQQGNEIQRRIRGYDLEKDISNLGSLNVTFPKNGLCLSENRRPDNNLSEFPVFIVGMPRSAQLW
ncbi:MAG: hypothetical protein V7727_10350 [Sneathiella sp.]